MENRSIVVVFIRYRNPRLFLLLMMEFLKSTFLKREVLVNVEKLISRFWKNIFGKGLIMWNNDSPDLEKRPIVTRNSFGNRIQILKKVQCMYVH